MLKIIYKDNNLNSTNIPILHKVIPSFKDGRCVFGWCIIKDRLVLNERLNKLHIIC